MSRETRTSCPYCGVGCGVIAAVDEAGAVSVRGDDAHPANFGRLCSKGSALADTLGLEERLLHPAVDGEACDWDTALDTAAARLRGIIDAHGPESVALYVSGQMLTEDYYVANKLVKGYLGTANIDTNSRLCMSSAVVGHKRAFGADTVPGCYEDIELADQVIITGSNLAWCHPVVYQRLVAAKAARPELKVVVIDPRGTATCDIADLHLALKPGTDVALFNGLLRFLLEHGHTDADFVARHTRHATEALDAAAEHTLEQVAELCGLGIAELSAFYAGFAANERCVTIFSQGVNQSSAGSDKVNSIINCHLLTGRIGRPGMGPFSITGQPNAMGGREVGGLANMLAAHMDLDQPDHRRIVQEFWGSPKIADTPGLKAVELFEAIHAGRIKAVWIIATNPVVSLPDAERVREALQGCELVIVSDIRRGTDTVQLADIVFPATGWAEKDGTVTNSERRISRQRGFLPAPGEARADWWILCEMARRLGFEGFDYTGPAEIFDEHARLSAVENNGVRDFDIGGLAGLSAAEYEGMKPIQWPVAETSEGASCDVAVQDRRQPIHGGYDGDVLSPTFLNSNITARQSALGSAPATPTGCAGDAAAAESGEGTALGDRPFPERWRQDDRTRTPPKRLCATDFYTPDRKARFVPVRYRPPRNLPSADYPFVLNTGRIRDQWHTMTRTGLAPKLGGHRPEPFVEVHPHDGLLCGVADGGLARLSSRWGEIVVRVRFSVENTRGSLFVPIHWNGLNASDARVGKLVNPEVDPHSGEPEFKHTPVQLAPFHVDWHGFILSRRTVATDTFAYWARASGEQFQRYELAGRSSPQDWSAWGRQLLGAEDPGADWLEYVDATARLYRAALVVDDRIEACVFISPQLDLPSREWLAGLFAQDTLGDRDRISLLVGRPADPAADAGPTVCSCFGVGRNLILREIDAQGLKTPEAIGACLKAGTNCGSCVPELRKLLAENAAAA